MNDTNKKKKEAYEVVAEDLYQRLLKAGDKEAVFLGNRGAIGSFVKNEQRMTSHMKGKTYGKTYVFCRVKFRPSARLKKALNESLEK